MCERQISIRAWRVVGSAADWFAEDSRSLDWYTPNATGFLHFRSTVPAEPLKFIGFMRWYRRGTGLRKWRVIT